jgi:hypothetical protein
MTAAFGFEFKIFDWAQQLVERMTARADVGFVLRFSSDGIVRLTMIPTQARLWTRIRSRQPHSKSYVVYDPFDVPEYAYLYWKDINRAAMESLIAARFADADFLPRIGFARHRELPDHSYPPTWNVMF